MEERRSHATHDGQAGSVSSSRPTSNVFGDEFEVADIGPMDGFRPDAADDDGASVRSYAPSEPYSFASSSRIQTSSAHIATDPRMTMAPLVTQLPNRDSTRKSSSHANPFASAQDPDYDDDDVHTPLARSPSMRSSNFAPGDPRRSISSASSRQYAGTESARFGAAGPSHPYTMYPQGTIARTASTATNAAVSRLRGSLSLRGGPAHPYAMYTQGVTQSDDEEDNAQNPVPVGFGLGQPYRRVRGPEGEEQDIIGDYGHAEQLPPYTRFAEDGTTKVPLPTEPEPSHTRSPIEGTDPTMPLMHERMAQRQSMTDASQLEQSTPLLADIASTTEASTLGKKGWKEKTWQEKKRTRICGIRFSFWLILLGAAAIIFAALVGSLVGYLAGTKRYKTASTTDPSSSYYDASLIPTPTQSMPSGSYSLALGTPQATQSDCLTDPAQRAAWSCDLAGKPALAISIGLAPQATPTMNAQLFYASGENNISYGAQYESISSNPASFIPVQDNDNSTLGPAFYFSQVYNKVVIVPESALTAPLPKDKRYWRSSEQDRSPIDWSQDWSRRAKANPGDKPWFCIFNNTLIEGFIYVSKPAVLPLTTTSASLSTSTSYATPGSTSATATSNPFSRITSAVQPAQAAPSDEPLHFASDRPQTTGPIAARDSLQRLELNEARGFLQRLEQNEAAWSQMSGLPYMMKLEERRVPNPPIAPYCQQYVVLDNQRANWVPDAAGNPIKIILQETDPPYVPFQSASATGNSKRSQPGACHCQWMHGAPG